MTMRILNPQKRGVPRVPCVPKLLKAFNFGVFKQGTQLALNWNTFSMAHKRCSSTPDTFLGNIISPLSVTKLRQAQMLAFSRSRKRGGGMNGA